MAGYKETPRQKMIGMMYLVLTALLALNVSKEILTAFVIVNESIEKTSENSTTKLNSLHDEFKAQYSANADKVGPFYNGALKAKNLSQELVNYIDSVKYAVIAETEGIPVDTAMVKPLADIDAKDNFDIPTRLLYGEEGFKNRLGYKIQEKLAVYRKEMVGMIKPSDTNDIKIGLLTEGPYYDADGVQESWVKHNFYHTILAADVTIFNKLVNEIRNTEFDVVNYLFKGITKMDFKFSSIEPRIIAPTQYVFQGDDYTAQIFMAAIDENSQPSIDYKLGIDKFTSEMLAGSTQVPGDSGVVHLTIPTKSLQPKEYTFAGRIGFKKPDGTTDYKNFSSSFIVAEPSANVAATKMNVFYRGVDNPVKISAAGVPETQLHYDIVGDGRIQKNGNELVVNNLTKKNVQTVTVNVYSGEGSERTRLGEQEFRVKDLPPPDIFVSGMTADGLVGKGGFLANPYIRAALPDYVNFEYKYKVTGFSMWVKKNGSDYEMRSNSSELTPDMKRFIEEARKNSKLFFTDIEVQGPLEKFKKNGALVITIN